MCKFGVAQIEAWIASNATQELIQHKLSMVCGLLPAFKDQCLALVSQVPSVINYLEQTYNADVICQMINVCSSKKVVPKKNDASCDLCKFAVGQIEAWLASNDTENIIQQRLAMICELLPGDYKDQCLGLVHQVPDIITWLESAYTPEAVCQILGICPTDKAIPKPVKKENDGSCSLCEFGVGQIEAWLASNQTEDLIQKRLSLICSLLPGGFKDECFSLVNQVPQIITWLESAYTPEAVCQLLGICSTKTAIVPNKPQDGECALCTFAVGQIEAWVASNQTVKNIQQKLTLVCNLLPLLQNECLSLVDQVPSIIQQLEQSYTPQVICTQLGLCSSKKAVVVAPKKTNDGECALCTFAVGQIEAWVASNQTVKNIQQKLTLVCNLLPLLQNECLSLVDQVPNIIQELEQSYTPQVICTQLGLCSSKKVLPAPIIKKSNDGNCELCKFGVGQIEAYLALNATQAQIQQELTQVCNVLSDLFKSECLDLVTRVPQIIVYLEQTYTPEVICQLLGVCSSKVAAAPKNSNDGECTLCQFGVGQIEAWLATNDTEARIQQKLTQVCNMLPSLKRECLDLVTRVPQIVTYLTQTYTPDVICQLIGACSSKKLPAAPKGHDDILCPACMFVVGLVEQQVKANHTVADIQAALDKVCNKLPHPFADACTSIVDTYTPQIVELISKKLDPSAICTALKLCKKREREAMKNLAQVVAKNNNMICAACKQLVTIADNFITQDSTKQEITAIVENICTYVPQGYSDMCKAIIQEYGPGLIDQLASKILDPSKVCAAVQACTSSKIAASHALHAIKIKLN
jgi:saposin